MSEKPDITEFQLYQGRVKLQFKESSHRYTVWVDQVKSKPASVTTVTSILDKSGPIQAWAIKATLATCWDLIKPGQSYSREQLECIFELARKSSYQKKQEAADIGTRVHDWLERFFQGELPAFPEDAQEASCVEAALAWADKHKVDFLLSEKPVYSIKHKVTGRLDGIALVDGKKSVIDFKTGGHVYCEALMQVSAYREFYMEETGDPIEQRVIIRLDKESGQFYACILEDNHDRDFNGFLGALELYNTKKEIDKDLRKMVFSTNPENPEKTFLDELEESL